jgi:hypothetical protein
MRKREERQEWSCILCPLHRTPECCDLILLPAEFSPVVLESQAMYFFFFFKICKAAHFLRKTVGGVWVLSGSFAPVGRKYFSPAHHHRVLPRCGLRP